MAEVTLICIDRDVEGWITPHVLTEAGFNISKIFWFNSNPRVPNYTDTSFERCWDETQRTHNVIICGHSIPEYGLLIQSSRSSPRWISHAELFASECLLHLFTCFCDFHSGTSTEYINLPGFDHQGNPGYFTVKEYHKSCTYRKWLGILRQRYYAVNNTKSVRQLFAEIITPHIQKYENVSKPWLFIRVTDIPREICLDVEGTFRAHTNRPCGGRPPD